ncbi:hypothetical protein HU200_018258 [Digitaria exilis]|uniref:Fe2OG dioxygenase domain-containing protein n=1 Tax=Digitaria exilis TaxID=1010633 RepID=A0A835KHE7_9POAL|nr:hypothetical protein HU200_018258 [Digitaria exilis]
MANLLDPELSVSETAKLGSACRDWGFFQLTNHGVDEAVIQQVKDSVARFFSLPLETKNAVAVRPGGFQGFGHHFNAPASNKLDWAECLILETQPVHVRNMEFWPANPLTFRHVLDRYSVETTSLAMRLLGFMATDLGISQETLQSAFRNKRQTMAMHHYPPCRRPERVLGMTPHTDGFGLTLLLHVDGTPGLQVRRGRRWFPVRPLPGGLLVNVGDVMEVLSNGAYGSVEHRVIPHAEKGRTTVVVFMDASVDGMVAPLPELLLKGGETPRYEAVERLEFSKKHLKALAQGQGKQLLDTKP